MRSIAPVTRILFKDESENHIRRLEPTLWLDAEYGITATATNTVSAWASRVGAVTFTQATAGNRPSLTNADGRENRLLQSGNLAVSPWGNNRTAISAATAVTAPDGSTLSVALLSNTTGFGAYHTNQALVHTAGTVYRTSVYAKKLDYDYLRMSDYDGTTEVNAWFNVSTGAVGTVQAGLTSTIESVGGGWYRCTITRATSASGTGAQYFSFVDADNTTNFNPVATGKGVYLWGPQVASSLADPTYIATTTYPVYRGLNGRRAVRFGGAAYMSRAHDAALDVGAMAANTLIASIRIPAIPAGTSYGLLGNQTVNAKGWTWRIDNPSGYTLYQTHQAGANTYSYGTRASPVNSGAVIAAVTSGGTVTHYVNGAAAGGGAITASVDAASNALNLGLSATQYMLGDLQTLLTFNKALDPVDRAMITRYLAGRSGAVLA